MEGISWTRTNTETGVKESIFGEREASKNTSEGRAEKAYAMLLERAKVAYKEGWKKHNAAMHDSSTGLAQFRNKDYIYPNEKGRVAIHALSPEVRARLQGHGVGYKAAAGQQVDIYPVEALAAILSSGELKGDVGALDGSTMVFDDAPFVLISNANEDLVNSTRTQLAGLRTVLVSGVYESMIHDLRNAFPGISFRTADELTDNVFERKEPPFVPFSKRAQGKTMQ